MLRRNAAWKTASSPNHDLQGARAVDRRVPPFVREQAGAPAQNSGAGKPGAVNPGEGKPRCYTLQGSPYCMQAATSGSERGAAPQGLSPWAAWEGSDVGLRAPTRGQSFTPPPMWRACPGWKPPSFCASMRPAADFPRAYRAGSLTPALRHQQIFSSCIHVHTCPAIRQHVAGSCGAGRASLCRPSRQCAAHRPQHR